jgi:hypothetical protein
MCNVTREIKTRHERRFMEDMDGDIYYFRQPRNRRSHDGHVAVYGGEDG